MNDAVEKVIFALDVETPADALSWTKKLAGEVGAFKVGLELFCAGGPALVRELVAEGARVFLDLKFHDIPNTVAGAVRSASKMGVWLTNLHAVAGAEAMARARAEADRAKTPPKLIAVTVLTSTDRAMLQSLSIDKTPAEQVRTLATLTRDAGLDGVVASPLEVEAIRAEWPEALIVTPGVRPAGADVGDQVRIATPGAAVSAGADYLVIGRPIRAAADPVGAARAIAEEIQAALEAGR